MRLKELIGKPFEEAANILLSNQWKEEEHDQWQYAYSRRHAWIWVTIGVQDGHEVVSRVHPPHLKID